MLLHQTGWSPTLIRTTHGLLKNDKSTVQFCMQTNQDHTFQIKSGSNGTPIFLNPIVEVISPCIPFSNRTSTTFRCPFCAARASGVFFLMSQAFGLAPDSSSKYTKFSRPKNADSCKAVLLSGPVWSTLAL